MLQLLWAANITDHDKRDKEAEVADRVEDEEAPLTAGQGMKTDNPNIEAGDVADEGETEVGSATVQNRTPQMHLHRRSQIRNPQRTRKMYKRVVRLKSVSFARRLWCIIRLRHATTGLVISVLCGCGHCIRRKIVHTVEYIPLPQIEKKMKLTARKDTGAICNLHRQCNETL
jgi:hypothetical protein